MADLVAALIEDEEAAWATWNHGRPLVPRQLGRLLGGYGIKSKAVRTGYGSPPKGFDLTQFADAFARYLSQPSENGVSPVTQSQANNGGAFSVTDSQVTFPESYQSVTPKPARNKACDHVTEKVAFLMGGEKTHSNAEVF